MAPPNEISGWTTDCQLTHFRVASWTQVPGGVNFIHVSAANDGTTWGIRSDHSIWERVQDRWERRPGGPVQISVGAATTSGA